MEQHPQPRAAGAARALPRLALEEESLILLNLPPELYPACRLVSPGHNARIMHPGSPFHPKLTVYLDLGRLVVQPGEEATVPAWLQEIFDFIKENKIVNVVFKNWTMPLYLLGGGFNRHFGQFDSFAQQLADVLSTVKKITVKNCQLQVPMFLLLLGKPGLVEMNMENYAFLHPNEKYSYPNLPTRNHNPTLTKMSVTDCQMVDFHKYQLAIDSMAKLEEFEYLNRRQMIRNLLSHKVRYRFLLSPRTRLRSITLIEGLKEEFDRSRARLCKDFGINNPYYEVDENDDFGINNPIDGVDENGDPFTVFEFLNRKLTLYHKTNC